VTARPTDDELYEIGATAWVGADHSGEEPFSTERRALYEAGYRAGALYEAKRCGHTLVPDVDWLLTDEAVAIVANALPQVVGSTADERARRIIQHLYAKITGEEQ
jgi:hypothetical protein